MNNVLVIIEGKEFLVFDYLKKEWQKGETIQEVVDQFDIVEKIKEGFSPSIDQLRVPSNAAIIYLDKGFNYNGRVVPVVVSGGNKHARVSKKVKGISFWSSFEKGARVYFAKEEVAFPDLPAPRYLHQMVSIAIGGKPHLLIIGGKERVYDATAVNTVYKINIEEFMKAKGGKGPA